MIELCILISVSAFLLGLLAVWSAMVMAGQCDQWKPARRASRGADLKPEPEPASAGVLVEDVTAMVQADLEGRAVKGAAHYGQRLATDSAVDGLVEAYHEALDQAVYLRLAIEQAHCRARGAGAESAAGQEEGQ